MKGFHKYPKIFMLGKEENKEIFSNPDDEIVIQEKLDGANFRFIFKDGNIIFGSRTQQITSDEGEEVNVQKNFRRCVQHIKKRLLEASIDLKLCEHLIFYGENMVKHTLDYDWDKIPCFLGFDIFNIDYNKFLSFEAMSMVYESFNLNYVPLIDITKAGAITEISDNFVPVSIYTPKSNPKQQAEGIVFKNYKKQIFAKYVRQQFKEENAKVFGGTPKYEETYTGKLTARYCTNARIDKCIFKLIDEGHILDMPLMKHLPKMVYDDIWEENFKEIINKKEIIDLGQFRKIVNNRCLSVLKQVITNNALK